MSLTKFLLVTLRGYSTQAKYPLEMLRMMVTQHCLLPHREAVCVFHSGFINTHGRVNTFVPSDQGVEWLVRDTKKVFKNSGTNKSEYFDAAKP